MSDKFEVKIKDFQSLKSVDMDFPEGITIITGRTNNGKSAVFRAIDSAIFNTGDDSMIRGGKRYYGVSIDNGSHKMVFMRDGVGKNEKSAYQFDDGTVQKKVGRSQLPEVAEKFNIRDVRMQNGTRMKINFWYQNDKPFLMDKTSGQLYEFLSLSSCDRYARVLKQMNADLRVLKSEISSVTVEIDTLKTINNRKQEFVDKNEGFDDVYYRAVALDQKKRKLDEYTDILNQIESLSKRLQSLRSSLINIKNRLQGIDFEGVNNRFHSVEDVNREVSSFNSVLLSISTLINKKNTIQVREKEVSERFLKYSSFVNNDLRDKILSYEKKINDNNVTSHLVFGMQSLYNRISDKKERLNEINVVDSYSIENMKESIEGVTDKKDTLMTYKRGIEYLQTLDNKIQRNKERLTEVNTNIVSNDRNLEDLKNEYGYCPYCGTYFTNKEHTCEDRGK